jgi:hypothetical protein
MVAKGVSLKDYCCKVCGKTDPNDFYDKSNMKTMCRTCHNLRSHHNQRVLKVKAIEYLGGACMRCEKTFESMAVYDFHHRDPNEKEFSWGNKRTSNWNSLKQELDKCDLLCSNCHRITHEEIWLDGLDDTHPEKRRRAELDM